MQYGRSYDSGHEHEYRVPDSDDAFIYEDGAIIIFEECVHEDVLSSTHSERHDETFYETGPQCDHSRSHRFDLTTIEAIHRTENAEFTGRLTESREEVIELYDQCPSFVEEIEERAAEKLYDDAVWNIVGQYGEDVDTGDVLLEIEYDGEPFYLTYEHAGTTHN